MAADSHRTIRSARRISMTWMILCLAGTIAVGFFGIAYFENNPEQAGNVSQNGERVFIELAKLLFKPVDCRYSVVSHSGCGYEYLELSIIGVL